MGNDWWNGHLSGYFPPVGNQGNLGSSASFATAALAEFMLRQQMGGQRPGSGYFTLRVVKRLHWRGNK
jgi:hypothetical protein